MIFSTNKKKLWVLILNNKKKLNFNLKTCFIDKSWSYKKNQFISYNRLYIHYSKILTREIKIKNLFIDNIIQEFNMYIG